MLQSTDMSGINYKARIVMSHNCTHDRLVLACVQTPPPLRQIFSPEGEGEEVCTQANLVQVYFIHAYSVNCNRIPQISNLERKMKKEHNKKCVEEKGTKLSSLPV